MNAVTRDYLAEARAGLASLRAEVGRSGTEVMKRPDLDTMWEATEEHPGDYGEVSGSPENWQEVITYARQFDEAVVGISGQELIERLDAIDDCLSAHAHFERYVPVGWRSGVEMGLGDAESAEAVLYEKADVDGNMSE